jgi:streptogramin lyase
MRIAALTILLLLPASGCGRADSAPAPVTPPAASAAAAPAAPVATDPPAAVVLAMLPDGAEKRAFVLDCTGCHQMDVARAFPNGRARTRDEWRAIVARMIGFAGWQGPFPIMSAARDADRTADFLARHLTTPPEQDAAHGDVLEADVREFAYPHPMDLPHDLAVDVDGSIVVTGMFTHRMHVLDPATGAWSEVSIPVAQANPRALEIDEAGDWWVLLGAPGMVARYRPAAAQWRTWPVGMYGHDVRPDGRGGAWFNGHFSKAPEQIGRVDTASGAVRVVDVPGPTPDAAGGGPIPYGMRIAPDGVVWMTELHGNRLVGHDPATGVFRFHELPTAASGPRRLDIDRAGIVWIPAYAAGSLVRFDPATGEFREHVLPYRDALPYVVRIDHARNRIWIGTGAADALFLFDPASASFRAVPLPTRGTLVRHLDVDERTGDVWAAYGASPGIPPSIARVRLPS